MRIRLPLPAGLAAALVALVLGGCGGGGSSGNGVASKSPEQIVGAAKSAAVGAASVHIGGAIGSEGKATTIDLELLARKGGKGRLSFEGASVEVIRLEQAIYLNGSAAFYRRFANAAAAQLLTGKWLKVPANSGNFGQLASLTELGKLIGTLENHGKLEKAGLTTINGQQVVAVRDVNKETLYVATTGPAYPAQVTKSGGSSGRIVFDRWNKPVTITAPPGAININQLQGGH